MSELVSNKISVEVAEDGYEAVVTVDEPNLLPSDIQAALEANGIVYGLNSDSISSALENVATRFVVAVGVRHADGIDGWFERLKKREETQTELKFGISNVLKGEIFGVIHKPTPGSVGIDVRGRKIEPKHGQPVSLFSGPNIKRTEQDDRIILEALIDGNLKFAGSAVEILPEHVIHQDIDYSDGELEFAGSLRITGDVKGNGSLKVRHNLYVLGSIEDAKIICGGDVTVKGSFVGRGDGVIRAAGNVEAHVVLNQTIEAGGSITITQESVNAHLVASESVIGRTAVIMGGVVASATRIEVRTLGGELYSTTRVRLGSSELLQEEAAAVDKEIEFQTKAAEEMKNEIYLLVRDRIDAKDFTEEKNARLKFLQVKLQEMNDSIKGLTAKKQETANEMKRKRSPKLVVLGTAHQSVVMEINGVRLALKQSCSNVVFEETKNEIIHTKNI